MEYLSSLRSLWVFVHCFQPHLLLSYYNFDFIFEEADSCQHQHVVQVVKTHPSLLCVLSIEGSIDRCADVKGIELQEAGGVGGCP